MEYPRCNLIKVETSTGGSIDIDKERLIVVKESSPDTPLRGGGELKGKSFFLPDRYDWVIVQDDIGYLCLVPLEKEDN